MMEIEKRGWDAVLEDVIREALGAGLRQNWAEDWQRRARQRLVAEMQQLYP